MNRRTLHNVLRILGVTLVVLLPVVLALWFAQIRAKAETSDRLHAFSQLALQKTEMVVYEADRAREKALQLKGTICSFAHQQYMLSVVRSLLYVDDLIYADGTLVLLDCCPPRYRMAYSAGELYKVPDIAIYYHRDTPIPVLR